jgi:hypothetical protein
MRNGFFLSLFIVLALGSSSLKAEQGKTMNILQNQPVFELKLNGFGALYRVRVNGAPVFNEYNSMAQTATRLPINHYMRSGDNTISISIWSGSKGPINPHAHMKIELVVSEHNKPDKEFVISTLNFDNSGASEVVRTEKSSLSGSYSSKHGFIADDKGDVVIHDITFKESENIFDYKRKITIPSSLPLWAFFNSDELPDYVSMSDEEYYQHMDVLLIEYLKVENAIAENNIDTILPMFKERNKELDLAFYNEPGTLAEKIKIALTEAANDDTATVAALKRGSLDFVIAENNKLNSLARGGTDTAVGLNYKDGTGSYSFDMIFRLKDGKWILTR